MTIEVDTAIGLMAISFLAGFGVNAYLTLRLINKIASKL